MEPPAAPKAVEPAAAPAAPKAVEPAAAPAAPKAAPVFKKINQATPAEEAAKAKTAFAAPGAPGAPAAPVEPVKPALVHNEPKFESVPKAAPVMKEPEPTAANYAISAVIALLFVGIAFAVVAFLL